MKEVREVVVAYASQTGTAHEIAKGIQAESASHGVKSKVSSFLPVTAMQGMSRLHRNRVDTLFSETTTLTQNDGLCAPGQGRQARECITQMAQHCVRVQPHIHLAIHNFLGQTPHFKI